MASRREPFALYLDTSALVKLFVDEAGSAKVRTLAAGRAGANILLASRLGYTEASVSFARMVHLGRLSAALLPGHLGALERYWDESIETVELSEDVLRGAERLAQQFPLRTYDAIHLSSALEAQRMLRGRFTGELCFLGFDDGLNRAARALGFAVPL